MDFACVEVDEWGLVWRLWQRDQANVVRGGSCLPSFSIMDRYGPNTMSQISLSRLRTQTHRPCTLILGTPHALSQRNPTFIPRFSLVYSFTGVAFIAVYFLFHSGPIPNDATSHVSYPFFPFNNFQNNHLLVQTPATSSLNPCQHTREPEIQSFDGYHSKEVG